MRSVRIRIELNKGRGGMPLGKMAGIVGETVEFLDSLLADLGIPKTQRLWLAERFDNGSVDFDCRMDSPLEDEKADRVESGLGMVFSNRYGDAATAMLIRPATLRRFARIGARLDPEEKARFGVYRGGGSEGVEWHDLTADFAAEIEEPILATLKSYGEVQGIVHAFFKEAERPYLKIRELSTQQLVNCYFSRELYRNAVEVLADPDAVVFVEGWTLESAETGFVEEIAVTDFRLAPAFSEPTYRAGLGSQPDFTGDLDSAAFVREARDG